MLLFVPRGMLLAVVHRCVHGGRGVPGRCSQRVLLCVDVLRWYENPPVNRKLKRGEPHIASRSSGCRAVQGTSAIAIFMVALHTTRGRGLLHC